MQLFMAFHGTDIVAIEQPIHLLTGECYNVIFALGPLEFFLGQRLVIQHETIVLPKQAFDFVR